MAAEKDCPKSNQAKCTGFGNGNDGLRPGVNFAALILNCAVEQFNRSADIFQFHPAKQRVSVNAILRRLLNIGRVIAIGHATWP